MSCLALKIICKWSTDTKNSFVNYLCFGIGNFLTAKTFAITVNCSYTGLGLGLRF